jgi:hypothetical protein
MFPSRKITVIAGDSTVSVNNFFNNIGNNIKCDLDFVDSGTAESRSLDINNFQNFVNRDKKQYIPLTGTILLNTLTDQLEVNNYNIDIDIENKYFTNVLIVDDLSTKSNPNNLRSYYEGYVANGIYLSISLSIYNFIYIYIYLYLNLSISLSIYLFIYLLF